MSSILEKLKQADQEHQKSDAVASDNAGESPGGVAPKGGISLAGSSPPAASPHTGDSVASDSATPSSTPSSTDAIAPGKIAISPQSPDVGGGEKPFEPVDFDSQEEKDSAQSRRKKVVEISAGQVFRSGEEEAPVGTGRRALYSVLGLVLFFCGGYAALLLEVIPGVNISSVLGLFGGGSAQEQVSFEQPSAVPGLTAVSGDDQSVLLPFPKIDIQEEVDFSDLQADEVELLTDDGRRRYAEKIAVISGIIAPEDVGLGDVGAGQNSDALLPELFPLEGGGVGQVNAESDGSDDGSLGLNTAAISRLQKRIIDASTPSDRFLVSNVKVYGADGTARPSFSAVAQLVAPAVPAVDGQGSEGASDTENSSVIAESPSDSTSSPTSSSVATEKKERVVVKPSKKGKEREQMLKSARALYARGNYAAAESVYRSVLEKHPKSIAGLRGLALVALVTGRQQLAEASYLNILKYYPGDPIALADLTNLRAERGDDLYKVELALRHALGNTPDAEGRIYFSLGNLYVQQERWSDAQEAYFSAYESSAKNPDYAYNLAVVLDYLNKPVQAVVYYKQAIELAHDAPSGFDADVALARVNELAR